MSPLVGRLWGDTDEMELVAGTWGGTNRGSSCEWLETRRESHHSNSAYRAVKLGSLPSSPFDNVLDADFSAGMRFNLGATTVTAVAVAGSVSVAVVEGAVLGPVAIARTWLGRRAAIGVGREAAVVSSTRRPRAWCSS